MPNPLAHLFPIEERPDGVYATITKESKSHASLPTIFTILDKALVLNYEADHIADVYNRGRGAPEKLGAPFEYYDTALDRYVEVSIADQKATATISSLTVTDKKVFTQHSFLYCLKRKGVKCGYDTGAIDALVANMVYDNTVVVALATAPVNGEDAKIEFKIDLAVDLKPKIRPDGTVDFHEIKTFILVAENQVIAEKAQPTLGKSGVDVNGAEIPAQPGKDVLLPAGQNTHTSPDGKTLFASKAGVLKTEGHQINVSEHLKIPNDVDFSVGNIKYSGELEIAGSVKPGFTVESDGSILIRGEVESAIVRSRNSSVTIGSGLLGKDDTHIYAKTSVSLFFAQGSSITSEGVITVDKYCMHCLCCCDTFKTTNRAAEVAGGHVKAYTSIELMHAGNASGLETRLSLVDKQKELLEAKSLELRNLRTQIVDKLEPIKKQVQAKAAIFKKAGDLVTDRQKLEMKKWIDAYNDLTMKLKYVDQKIEELKNAIASRTTFEGFIKISGDIYPGVIIDLYGITRIIKTQMSNTVFRMIKGDINTGE